MGAATRGFTDARGEDAGSSNIKFANTVYGQTAALHVELNDLEKSAAQLEEALAGVTHRSYPTEPGSTEIEAVQAVPQAVQELQHAVHRARSLRNLLDDVRSRLALS